MNTYRKVYLGLGLLCAIWAIGMMITVVTIQGKYPVVNTGMYTDVAQSLLETGSRYGVHEYLTPGYPGFLAIEYFLFGEERIYVRIIHVLIGAATAFLVSVMTLHIAGMIAAFVTALFLLLNPNFNALLIRLETDDASGMIVFIPFLFYAIQIIRTPTTPNQNFIYSGFFLGFAALIRPVFYYLFFLLLPALLVFLWCQHVSWDRIARKVMFFVLPWLVITGSVQIRNGIILKDLGYSSRANLPTLHTVTTILTGEYSNGTAKKDVLILNLLRTKYPCYFLKKPEPCFALGDTEQIEPQSDHNMIWIDHGKQLAWLYILENPFKTLRTVYENKLILFRGNALEDVKEEFHFDFPVVNSKYEVFIQFFQGKNRAWFPLMGLIYKLLFVFFSLTGLMFLFFSERKHRFIAALVLLIFIYFNIILILTIGTEHGRYRLPIVPVQSMFVGVGVAGAFLWARKGWENLRKHFARNASV